MKNLSFYPDPATGLNKFGRNFYEQGACQFAVIFTALGIGIAFGILAAFIIRAVYVFEEGEFYRD